jgi:hypothetical protein
MSIWKALFGKPEPRKSPTYEDWHKPASNVRRQSENCNENDVDGMGYYITRDCGNAEQFTIDPECGDAYDPYWERFDEWYNEKINLLKQQGRSFFVIKSFRGHDEGAEVYYRICESREQMEEVYKSYDDYGDCYIPHEFIMNVLDGEEVEAPPDWWGDYENDFKKSEELRRWKESGSSTYRL